jgi:hypothetical protein
MDDSNTTPLLQEQKEAEKTVFSVSRIWTVTWTILTWLFTFAFVILLFVVYTNQYQYEYESRTYKYDRHKIFTSNFGCIYKNQWTSWDDVFKIYKNKPVEGIYTPPEGTFNRDAVQSTIMLDAVMKAMMCHGTNPRNTETTTTFPITGGISNALVATDSETGGSFKFASEACRCVYDHHMTVFNANFLASTPDYDQLSQNYLTSGEGISGGLPLMKQCLFGKKTTHWFSVEEGCWISMSPFNVVLYTNIIAGIFGALYIVDASTEAAMQQHSDAALSKMIRNFVGGNMMFSFFVLLNFALGLSGILIAHASTGSKAALILVFSACLVIVTLFYVSLKMNTSSSSSKDGVTKKFRNYIFHNVVDLQRMCFWIQYIVTLPGLILFHDAMNQQRSYDFISSRLLTSFGIGFLGIGYDCICMFHEKTPKGNNNAASADIKSAMWWTWGVWVACSASLFYISEPVSLMWSLMSGPHTLVRLAAVIYIIGIPLVSIPKMLTSLIQNDKERQMLPLSLRMIPDFIARILMIVSVYFWLYLAP